MISFSLDIFYGLFKNLFSETYKGREQHSELPCTNLEIGQQLVSLISLIFFVYFSVPTGLFCRKLEL